MHFLLLKEINTAPCFETYSSSYRLRHFQIWLSDIKHTASYWDMQQICLSSMTSVEINVHENRDNWECWWTFIVLWGRERKYSEFTYSSWRRASSSVLCGSACIHSLHNCSLHYSCCSTWAKDWKCLCCCLPSSSFPCTCAIWASHWHLPHTAISGRKMWLLKDCFNSALSNCSSNLSELHGMEDSSPISKTDFL